MVINVYLSGGVARGATAAPGAIAKGGAVLWAWDGRGGDLRIEERSVRQIW